MGGCIGAFLLYKKFSVLSYIAGVYSGYHLKRILDGNQNLNTELNKETDVFKTKIKNSYNSIISSLLTEEKKK